MLPDNFFKRKPNTIRQDQTKEELIQIVGNSIDMLKDIETSIQYADDEIILDSIQTQAMKNLDKAIENAISTIKDTYEYLVVK